VGVGTEGAETVLAVGKGLHRPSTSSKQFPAPDFCLRARDGWRSRQTISGSIFVALPGSHGEAKLSPQQARGKIPSARELFTHQIFFNFWFLLFNPKDVGLKTGRWIQKTVLSPSMKMSISTAGLAACCPGLGSEDTRYGVLQGHAAPGPSERGSDPSCAPQGNHHLPSKAIPQVKDRFETN